MKYQTYPNYKPSGVEWLGDVPEHWDAIALKRKFRIVGGSTPKSDQEVFWDGEIIWVTPSDLSKLPSLFIGDSQRKITLSGLTSCGTTLVPENSIILSTRAPIGSLAIATTELCTNQGCKSLVPLNQTNSKFFGYLLSVSTTELNIRGRGTTFLELSGDELGAFKIPFPSKNEQQKIAQFLDHETAKIDTLIEKQQRLIALLKEKRQAVISHAVTKGLNPNAPMKPSGVEWLGDVPVGWEVAQLKFNTLEMQTGP
ncbi:MAG: restriction endonuclease subunit S, partial [Methylococcales bacterium]|nr:restriction endonuclease subunit S [Methylococcales bacterium]